MSRGTQASWAQRKVRLARAHANFRLKHMLVHSFALMPYQARYMEHARKLSAIYIPMLPLRKGSLLTRDPGA